MLRKNLFRIVVSGLAVLTLGILLSAVGSANTPVTPTKQAFLAIQTVPASPSPAATHSPIATPQPTTTVLPTMTPTATAVPTVVKNPTPTPDPTLPYVIVNAPDVPLGAVIPLPARINDSGSGTVIKRTALAPHLTVKDALDMNKVSMWARGGPYYDDLITVTVTYGLGTLGYETENGDWTGFSVFPDLKCSAVRKCVQTGKLINRYENRPMWLLDYKNLWFYGTGANFNHTVYAEDDASGIMIYGWAYDDR